MAIRTRLFAAAGRLVPLEAGRLRPWLLIGMVMMVGACDRGSPSSPTGPSSLCGPGREDTPFGCVQIPPPPAASCGTTVLNERVKGGKIKVELTGIDPPCGSSIKVGTSPIRNLDIRLRYFQDAWDVAACQVKVSDDGAIPRFSRASSFPAGGLSARVPKGVAVDAPTKRPYFGGIGNPIGPDLKPEIRFLLVRCGIPGSGGSITENGNCHGIGCVWKWQGALGPIRWRIVD